MSRLLPAHRRCWLLAALALLAACQLAPAAEPFATGLNQPRGMAFDGAGNLYVAEAGALDPNHTGQVSPIVNQSGRVLRITPDRQVSVVADRLPFTNYVAAGDIGATDVAVLGGDLYILTGEGYDDQLSRAVLRAAPGEPPRPIASIRRFVEATVPMDSLVGAGASHASNPYAMAVAPDGGALYVSDGASGRVLHVALDGTIALFAELPGMPPLTGLTFGPDGRLYVAQLSALPLAPGTGGIWVTDAASALTPAVPRLTQPIDVGFDASGAMYVLEFGDGGTPARPYAPASGRLLRIAPDGARHVVLGRLNYPTAMVFSGTGDLYIALSGAFSAAGQGAIVRVPCRALGAPEACPARAGQ
jgi:sugar lactone lactonase YvrE